MKDPSLLKWSKGKILIVDDEPDTLEIIRKLLQFEGFEVLTASSGEEGVKRVAKEHSGGRPDGHQPPRDRWKRSPEKD